MALQGGDLDRPITIQSHASTSASATGAPVVTTSDVCTCFAQITEVRSEESLRMAAQTGARLVRIVIRYRTGITSLMTALDGTREYTFQSVNDAMKRDGWLSILAEERVTPN